VIGSSTIALLKPLSIVIVAGHSIILGGALLIAPGRVLALTRWPLPADMFFASQSGVFLVILGFAYLAALWHEVFVWLIVGSKLAAVLFLFGHGILGGAPFQVMLLGAADACLGLLVVAGLIAKQEVHAEASVAENACTGEPRALARR